MSKNNHTTKAESVVEEKAEEVSIALEDKAEKVSVALEDKAVDVGEALKGTAREKRNEHIISFLITFLWLYISISSGVLDVLMDELRSGELTLATVMATLIALGRNALRVLPDLASLYFLKVLDWLRDYRKEHK